METLSIKYSNKIILYLAGLVVFLLFIIVILYSRIEQMEAEIKILGYTQQDTFVFLENK